MEVRRVLFRSVVVSRNVFTDLAGGAIVAGGVRRDAHHPSDPRMINRQLTIVNHLIRSVSTDYSDNSAIISTYDAGAQIVHNDISDMPYEARTEDRRVGKERDSTCKSRWE